ncbi:Protein of unknown function [Cotesia congregata]|uniref:Integrase zinc-binding domain-containing protein n=1 Tax=Cotesia congregata TaxID=51543 RepID=A0A8J2MU03_COTCN|nr:Protein of unknown function [Cotesia congregata]
MFDSDSVVNIQETKRVKPLCSEEVLRVIALLEDPPSDLSDDLLHPRIFALEQHSDDNSEPEQASDSEWEDEIETLCEPAVPQPAVPTDTNKPSQASKHPKNFPDWKILEDHLCYRRPDPLKEILGDEDEWKRVLRDHEVPETLKRNHEEPDAGHLGRDKMYERIKINFYWPGMSKDVEDFVQACETCKQVKYKQTSSKAPLQTRQPIKPWAVSVGDKVYYPNRKLSNIAAGYSASLGVKYLGPALISKIISPLVVELKNERGKLLGQHYIPDLKLPRRSDRLANKN